MSQYQQLAQSDLFIKLQNLGLALDAQRFVSFAHTFDTPEALAIAITEGWDRTHSLAAYRILFELWRRLMPEKQTLSTFCAAFDRSISDYLEGKCPNFEAFGDQIEEFAQILERSIDEGVAPKEAFTTLSFYFSHDLESFFYDYILEEIEERALDYAKELIEEFSPYVERITWFEYLYARVLIKQDPDEGFEALQTVIFICQKKQDLELNLEILSYLADNGHSLFLDLLKSTLTLATYEDDFSEILEVTLSHFTTIVQADKVTSLLELQRKRQGIASEAPLSPSDPDIQTFRTIVWY